MRNVESKKNLLPALGSFAMPLSQSACRIRAAALVPVAAIILLGSQSTNAADSFANPNSPIGNAKSEGRFRISDLGFGISQGATPGTSPPTEKDCQSALFAREALLNDDCLAPLNIGVTVRSGVATLWGTVPSPALAHRAEERIRLVPGLAQVKNDLRISNEEDTWLGSNKAGPPLLMPPIAVPRGPDLSLTPPPTITVSSFGPAPKPMSAPMPPLVEAIERMGKESERFHGIRFEVQGGIVHLWGSAATSGDIFTWAQQIAHIPGVERVVIERSR